MQRNRVNGRIAASLPAFESIHELSWRFQTFAHQMRLLPHYRQGVFKQPGLVFHGWRGGHGVELQTDALWPSSLGNYHRRCGG
jgi:hypothetical protein